MNSDEYANEIAMRERRADQYLRDKFVKSIKSEKRNAAITLALIVLLLLAMWVGAK